MVRIDVPSPRYALPIPFDPFESAICIGEDDACSLGSDGEEFGGGDVLPVLVGVDPWLGLRGGGGAAAKVCSGCGTGTFQGV